MDDGVYLSVFTFALGFVPFINPQYWNDLALPMSFSGKLYPSLHLAYPGYIWFHKRFLSPCPSSHYIYEIERKVYNILILYLSFQKRTARGNILFLNLTIRDRAWKYWDRSLADVNWHSSNEEDGMFIYKSLLGFLMLFVEIHTNAHKF